MKIIFGQKTMKHFSRLHPSFRKSVPISNRLNVKSSLKLKIPASPESDGEIYVTPNTSTNLDDSMADKSNNNNNNGNNNTPFGSFRMNKIQSMSSISSQSNEIPPSAHTENNYEFRTPECLGVIRMNSLGNLSQYERKFGATPISLQKLKDDFEKRRQTILEQRKSMNDASPTIEFKVPKVNGRYRKRIGIGDTKYIGTDVDTPEQRRYNLTKMKSMGTISDLSSERVNYDPFLTPLLVRKHPSSLHSFEEEHESSESSDSTEPEVFLRNQPEEQIRFINEMGLLRGSFERGYRRSFNKKHDASNQSTIPLRQSDGYFQMPNFPAPRQVSRSADNDQNSAHSLPSDGKINGVRYEHSIVLKETTAKSNLQIL